MTFAVIQTGGKQYRVSPGTMLSVERIAGEMGSSLTFDRVLMFQPESGDLQVGSPIVANVVVTAEVIDQFRGDKIRVFTYKPKKRQSRTLGHRQNLTRVKVVSIGAPVAAKKEAKASQS